MTTALNPNVAALQWRRSAACSQLIALIAVGGGLAIAHGKAFGPYQTTITAWVIAAGKVRPATAASLTIVGVVIATAFTVIGAAAIERWGVVPVGVLAGVFASLEAAKVHDATSDTTPPA